MFYCIRRAETFYALFYSLPAFSIFHVNEIELVPLVPQYSTDAQLFWRSKATRTTDLHPDAPEPAMRPLPIRGLPYDGCYFETITSDRTCGTSPCSPSVRPLSADLEDLGSRHRPGRMACSSKGGTRYLGEAQCVLKIVACGT